MRIILTSQEKEAISRAILEAEKKTNGEIVPIVVRASDSYLGAHWQSGILAALLSAFSAYLLFPHWNPIGYLILQIPALFVGFLIGSIPAVKRILSGKKFMQLEVHQKALELFYRHRLHLAVDGTGVLIFVSLLEHRVEILGDRGISSKIGQNEWEAAVNDLISETKKRNLAKGLIRAIEDCGVLLARHFPAKHENPDELRNDVIVEE
ncbi:MAG: hypothetical protein HY391_03200 [Deltaproteobacteria bacterium]|nr:hypothetical protein [Deltaproteobacteria bacterium]